MSNGNTSVKSAIQWYGDRLCVLLRQCSEDFQQRPDAFLWGCRRCLECISYSFHTLKTPGFQPGNNEGEVANFAKNLPGDLRPAWRFVLETSNLAVHVQGPQQSEDHKESAQTCRGHLNKLVRWFFQNTDIWEGHLPEDAAESLKRLLDGGTPSRNHEQEIKEAEARVRAEFAEKIQQEREDVLQIRRELRSAQDTVCRLEQALGQAQSEQERVKIEARQAEAQQRELRSQLAEQAGKARAERGRLEEELRRAERHQRELRSQLTEQERQTSPTPTPPPVSPPSVPSNSTDRAPARRWPLALAVVLSLLITGFGVWQKTTFSASTTVLPPLGSSQPPAPDVPQEKPPQAQMAAPSAKPLVLSCPPSMLLVPESTVDLRQPHRPYWPSPLGQMPTATVAPFCIDKDLVKTTDYQACADRGLCSLPSRPPSDACSWTWRREHPLLCMKHEEAEQFCQKMRGGRLPTVLERQAAHGPSSSIKIHNRTGEWASDLFPAAAFHRGPPLTACKKGSPCFMLFAPLVTDVPAGAADANALDQGWNRDLGTERRADLAFRCVTDR